MTIIVIVTTMKSLTVIIVTSRYTRLRAIDLYILVHSIEGVIIKKEWYKLKSFLWTRAIERSLSPVLSKINEMC